MGNHAYTSEQLIEACGDLSFDAGISIHSELAPLAGDGSPVKPATYEGGQYQLDRRWIGEGEDRRVVDAVVIDNVPSQANRLEAALFTHRSLLGLPEVTLDLSMANRPAHVPAMLSSFLFPHRQADAYLRDAVTGDGTSFVATDAGKELLLSTADAPDALLKWFPQALLFGFWQSHYGKKSRTQAKLARSWVSEIVGYEPATVETRVMGLKGDPINLTTDHDIKSDKNDATTWSLGSALKNSANEADDKGAKRLSEIGHGQVPFTRKQDTAPAAISFQRIVQQSTVSFSSLRRINAATPEASAAARALLVALGVVAHVGAFGRSFTLRSGADLRTVDTRWLWLGSNSDDTIDAPSMDVAMHVFHECVNAAEKAGLPVGSSSWETILLMPSDKLAKVIQSTFPNEQ